MTNAFTRCDFDRIADDETGDKIEGKPTLHGLRVCFGSWAPETKRDTAIAGDALAHRKDAVTAVYFRSPMFARRAALMQA